MKDIKKHLIILLLIFLFASCSSKKSVHYLQDANDNSTYKFSMTDHIISPGDILKISIKTKNPENLVSISEIAPTNASNQNRETLIYDGFPVSVNGYIDYPELGKIKAKGFTLNELSTLMSDRLSDLNILIDPVVEIKVLNLNFTVLGEVNNPGKYYFDEYNLNILQALGIAGDLTITGDRKKIKLIRFSEENKEISEIDLTKTNFLTEDTFQIISGDIIVVDQNTTRVKNAGIIGNSGTLLSLLSFILSSIIVISR